MVDPVRSGRSQVAGEIGDAHQLEVVVAGESMEAGEPGHRAVVVDDLAENARRRTTGEAGEALAYRFGLIGASDTHDARPGNGFKEFGRIENTEALARHPLTQRFLEIIEDYVADNYS